MQGYLVGLIDGLEDFVGMLVGLGEGLVGLGEGAMDFVGMRVEGAMDGVTVTRFPL